MSFFSKPNLFRSRVWLIVMFCSLFVSIGCDSSRTPSSAEHRLLPADADSSAGNKEPDINAAEAEAFAEAWVSVIDGTVDGKAGEELIFWVGIVERALKPFKVNERFRKGFMNGAMSKLAPELINQLKSVIANGGTYKLVKVVSRNGERHIVFRLVDPNSGLNYHDFQLERANGKVRASHFFIALTGEEYAETISTLLGPTIISSNSILGKVTGEQQRQLKVMQDLKKLKTLSAAGNKAEALRVYDSLPEDTRQLKAVLLMKMQILDVDEDEAVYLETIEKYSKLYPNDPSLGIVTLDAAYIRKDVALLEKSRTLLQEWTGGDPYLDLLMGGLLAELGEVDKAVQLTKDIDPSPLNFADPHDYKMSIAMANKDYQTVLKELRVLRDKFGYQLGDLKGVEGFEGFVDSPEYAEWTSDQ